MTKLIILNKSLQNKVNSLYLKKPYKLSIAHKEINESLYWLELLKVTDYLNENQFKSVHTDAVEIIKIITSIIKTSKSNC